MTNSTLNHKEMTAHIRTCIKRHGVKALVRKQDGLGNDKIIQVNAPKYGIEFSEQAQREIRQIAVNNGLTLVMNMPIVVDQMTNPCAFNFYYHGAA